MKFGGPSATDPPAARLPGVYLSLGLAVIAVSCAAPLIRLAASGPQTVAFWRVAIAASAAWVLLLLRRPTRATGESTPLVLLAGVLLGLHFSVWIASLYHTSVANSVLLVCTQPVWAALIGRALLKERVPARGWLGITLALAGTAAATGFDHVRIGGDLLAIAGAILAASYMVVGRHARRTWDTLPYIARVYGAAAVTLLPIVFLSRGTLWPAAGSDWWILLALAAVPTGVGHTLYNALLRRLPAYVVATGITGEPIGAALLAYWWIGERPPTATLLVAPLILAGIVLVAQSHRRPAG
jgi:drug/metabolite transporter (DMT)-like permease